MNDVEDLLSLEDSVSEISDTPTSQSSFLVPDVDSVSRKLIPLISSTAWKSWVWKYCGKYPKSINNSKYLAVCLICRDAMKDITIAQWEINIGKTFSTGKISQHFDAKHREIFLKHSMSTKSLESEGSMISFMNKGKKMLFT